MSDKMNYREASLLKIGEEEDKTMENKPQTFIVQNIGFVQFSQVQSDFLGNWLQSSTPTK